MASGRRQILRPQPQIPIRRRLLRPIAFQGGVGTAGAIRRGEPEERVRDAPNARRGGPPRRNGLLRDVPERRPGEERAELVRGRVVVQAMRGHPRAPPGAVRAGGRILHGRGGGRG